MTLRDEPVVRHATLADGRVLEVRVVVPDDPYVERSDVDTVVVELRADGEPLGVATTPLSAADRDEALVLAERVREGLESGAVEPTAEGIDRLAATPPA